MFDERETAVAGVALAVELRAPSSPGWAPGAPVPQRISEALPVAGRTDAELCDELRRVGAIKAMLAAYEMELALGLAALRPAEPDPPTRPRTRRCRPGARVR
jgi:hypothetical protein